MKKTLLLILLATALLYSCGRKPELLPGPWLGVIRIDSADGSLDVPFNMMLSRTPDGQWMIEVLNAEENILINEVVVREDSLFFKFPFFSSEIACRITGDSLLGSYYPKGREKGTAYMFLAKQGTTDRFPSFSGTPARDVTGRWKILENPGSPDSSVMVGEFVQENGRVTGTVLSTTGDYRSLEGKVAGNKFMVSAVDGAHTILFMGDLAPDGSMSGRFIGSPAWRSTWKAVKNSTITLPKGEELVRLKKDAPAFTFTFPDINGRAVSLEDTVFKGKVIIVDAMGSWCPNCLDQALFLNELYERYKTQGLEVISLCLEDETFESSRPKMHRFVSQTGVGYTFLYAGPRGQESIRKVMYVAEGMLAYPTTLFIDRSGKARKVETGFSGPWTGIHYNDMVRETTLFVEKLLKEEPPRPE